MTQNRFFILITPNHNHTGSATPTTTMMSVFGVVTAALFVTAIYATTAFQLQPPPFCITTRPSISSSSCFQAQPSNKRSSNNNNNNNENNDDDSQPNEAATPIWNSILKEMTDMWRQMDNVMDDFFNKRMGNGQVFYGERKYKPNGSVQGQYNGMGYTDKSKIEYAKFRKEMKQLELQEKEESRRRRDA